MKHKMPVYTLALLGALALAALSGGLLTTSDNVVYAADPDVRQPIPTSRSVPENTPPGVNIGAPISATDDDETSDDEGVRQHADLHLEGTMTRHRSTSTLRPDSSSPRPRWTTRIRVAEPIATPTTTR